jgi:hypothetical protein
MVNGKKCQNLARVGNSLELGCHHNSHVVYSA